MCCDSKGEVLVDGHSWSKILLSCSGRGGCRWHFLAPFLSCIIPRADSHTIICAVRQQHRYKFGNVLPVMAGDCGDKIPSKSKPQSAGITSCANFENILHVCYLQTSIFFFFPSLLYCIFREFLEYSRNSSSVMVFSNFFQFFDLLPLVFASPEDLCGSFFLLSKR